MELSPDAPFDAATVAGQQWDLTPTRNITLPRVNAPRSDGTTQPPTPPASGAADPAFPPQFSGAGV